MMSSATVCASIRFGLPAILIPKPTFSLDKVKEIPGHVTSLCASSGAGAPCEEIVRYKPER